VANGSASRLPSAGGRQHGRRSGAAADEPTAQLDVRGEAEIFDRLLTATRSLHNHPDLASILHVRHADRICVLEHGRVIEFGNA